MPECPDSPTGKHVALRASFLLVKDDGNRVYVDVVCEYCNRTGCAAVVELHAPTDWE